MARTAHEVAVVKPGQTYVGKQGFTYGAGVSAETVGASKVCMNVLPMPPGAVAKAHYHKGIETIAYMLEGECAVYYGDDLRQRVLVQKGDHCFVAADVPHAPRNESGKPCTFLVVHSSGSDQDGIVLLPELDALLANRLSEDMGLRIAGNAAGVGYVADDMTAHQSEKLDKLIQQVKADRDALVSAGLDPDELDRQVEAIEQELRKDRTDKGLLATLLGEFRVMVDSAGESLLKSGVLAVLNDVLGTGVPHAR